MGGLRITKTVCIFQLALSATFAATHCDSSAKKLREQVRANGLNLSERAKIERLFHYFKYRNCETLDEAEKNILHEEIQNAAEKQLPEISERLEQQTKRWNEKKNLQTLISQSDIQEASSELKLVRFAYSFIKLYSQDNGIIHDRRLYIREERTLCEPYPLGCKIVLKEDAPYLRLIEPVFATFSFSAKSTSAPKTYTVSHKRAPLKNITHCPDLRSCNRKKTSSNRGRFRAKPFLNKELVSIPLKKHDESLYLHLPQTNNLLQKIQTLERQLDEIKKRLLFDFEVIEKPIKLLFIINVCGFTVQNTNTSEYLNYLDYAFSQIIEFTPALPAGSTFKIAITSSNKEWPDDYILSNRFLSLPEILVMATMLKKYNRTFKELTQPEVVKKWMNNLPLPKKSILNTLNEGIAPILEDIPNWKESPDLIVSFSDGWPGTEDKLSQEQNVATDSGIPIQFKPIGSKHIETYFSIVPNTSKGDVLLPGDTGPLTLQLYLDLQTEIQALKEW